MKKMKIKKKNKSKGAVAEVEVKGKKSKKGKPEKSSKKSKGKKVRAKKEVPSFDPIKEKQNAKQQIEDLVEIINLAEILPGLKSIKKFLNEEVEEISERDEKALVKAMFDAITENICGHITKGGSGQFQWPKLFKIVRKEVAAKPARTGIDPFTKEKRKYAAKPATKKVKIRPAKLLKDVALG